MCLLWTGDGRTFAPSGEGRLTHGSTLMGVLIRAKGPHQRLRGWARRCPPLVGGGEASQKKKKKKNKKRGLSLSAALSACHVS